LPFGNLLVVLESRVKDIYWAPEHMSTPKINMIGASTSPELIRRKSAKSIIWKPIVHPDRIVHGKGPQVEVSTIGPAKLEMNEI
jgi:hypothetical protein